MKFDHSFFDQLKVLQLDLINKNPKIEFICVAGGAVRDSLLERPIKDIDVFFVGELDDDFVKQTVPKSKPYVGNSFVGGGAFALGALGLMPAPTSSYSVYDFFVEGLPTIQLIKVEDIEAAIDNFPCNLSKVFYDHLGVLQITKEFMYDANMEILTFSDSCPQEYKDRMYAKYPTFL